MSKKNAKNTLRVMPRHCYKYLWRKCLEPEIIAEAWLNARKGKARRSEVDYIERNFEACVSRMREMIFNTRPDGDPDKAFYPVKHRPKHRFEFGKIRKTYCPTMWEQWVHHIVVLVLKPILLKTSYNYSCGSVPNKGSSYGKREIERAIRKRGFKYYAKLDVRHFFHHVGIGFVIKELKLLIDDEWLFFLIRRIFFYFPNSLPLGFYPSQWFCNYILCRVDWLIKKRRPICYVRYVDDFVICHNNKKWLHTLIRYIKQYIGRKLRLKLKENWQVVRFDYHSINRGIIGRPLDFMGFVFYRNRTIIRRSTYYRTCRFAKKLATYQTIALRQAQSMISRMGPFKTTDTIEAWRLYIQPYISITSLKSIIRKYQRRYINENRLERGVVYRRTEAVCQNERLRLPSTA